MAYFLVGLDFGVGFGFREAEAENDDIGLAVGKLPQRLLVLLAAHVPDR